MITVLQALGCHFVTDVLQPWHMIEGKRKIWQMMFTHAACSSGLMAVFGCTWDQFIINWLSHVLIDSTKSRWHWHNSMWLDQILHAGVIVLIFSGVLNNHQLGIISGTLMGLTTGAILTNMVSLAVSKGKEKVWK